MVSRFIFPDLGTRWIFQNKSAIRAECVGSVGYSVPKEKILSIKRTPAN